MADSIPPAPVEVTGSRVVSVIRTNSAFIVLTMIVISLRVFARAYLNRSFGIDDYLISFAALFALGQGIVVIIGTKYGLGLHALEIYDFASKQIPFLKIVFVSSLIYSFAMFFTKMSILVFYLRLQPKRKFEYAVYAIMFLVIGITLGAIFGITFACSPVAYSWDLSLNGTCVDRTASYYANSALNVFSDLAIYFLAIPLVKGVQLPSKEKRALYLILGLGCFVCVAGIIRMYTLHTVTHDIDATWALIDPFNWSTIEANFGIMCACIPSFKVILSRYWPKFLSSTTHDPASNASGSGGAVSSAARVGVSVFSSLNRDNSNFSPEASNYQATIQLGRYSKFDDDETSQNHHRHGGQQSRPVRNQSSNRDLNSNGSEEHIIQGAGNEMSINIYKTTDFKISIHRTDQPGGQGEGGGRRDDGEGMDRSDSGSDFERRYP